MRDKAKKLAVRGRYITRGALVFLVTGLLAVFWFLRVKLGLIVDKDLLEELKFIGEVLSPWAIILGILIAVSQIRLAKAQADSSNRSATTTQRQFESTRLSSAVEQLSNLKLTNRIAAVLELEDIAYISAVAAERVSMILTSFIRESTSISDLEHEAIVAQVSDDVQLALSIVANASSDGDLARINLAGSCLMGCQFKDKTLRNADLRDSNLQAVDFSGCSLISVDLSGANLFGASLEGARIVSCNLTDADLRNSRMRSVALEKSVLVNANLHNAQLQEADLAGADFTKANLAEADLRTANCSNAKFAWCNLFSSALDGANLEGCDFTEAVLAKSSLAGCQLSGAIFSGTTLHGARLSRSIGLEVGQLDLANGNESTTVPGKINRPIRWS